MIGLGIDCGGSGTRWAVQDERGTPIKAGIAPAASGHFFAPAERARFEAMVAALHKDIAAVDAIVAGVTGLGAGTPEAAQAAQMLGQAFALPPERVAVGDDMWIAYRALFAPGAGHVVSAGSGSIGYHLRADGTAIRVGGRGFVVDDAGSAFWIGREALRVLLRRLEAEPAAGSRGRLAEAIYGAIGGSSWADVRSFVYADPRPRVAALAQAVADAADEPDAAAILTAAGEELARLALVLIRREGAHPVALIGRAATLHPLIHERFAAALPDVVTSLAAPDAAATAALLAARGPEHPPAPAG